MRGVLLFAVLSTTWVSGARAQADEGQRARELFEEADVRIEQGRLAEARDLLNESLELVQRVSTAFNLAVVYRAMGETLRAEDTLDELLAGEHGELPETRRGRVEALRDEVRGEVAVLELRIEGADGVAVRIDGQQIATIDGGGSLRQRVDAGSHTVVASAPDGRILDEAVEVGRGEELALALTLPPAGGSDDEGDDNGGVFASPWFWIVTGVVLAAGATTTILVLTANGQDPITDPVFPVGMVLRSDP